MHGKTAMALRLPIRAQLLLLGLAVGLPAAGLFAWHAYETSASLKESAFARVSVLARGTADQLDNFLSEQEGVLARVAARPLVRALDPKRCDPALLEFASLNPDFLSMGLRDATGRLVCTSNRNPIRIERPGQSRWFDEGIQMPGLSAGDATPHPLGRWISVLTHPVRRDDGMVAGLVGLPIDLVAFQGRLFRSLPHGAEVIVADRSRRVLMRSADPAKWIGSPLPAEFSEATRKPARGLAEVAGVDGVSRLYAVATVPRAGWQVIAGLPEAEVLSAFRAERNELVALGLAMLAAVLALAWWSGTVIARPMRALGLTAARVAAGETGARAALTGPAELEEVARQFNRMLDTRDRLREEHVALVDHFGGLARLARDIILLVDPDGRIVEANEAAAAAYGWSVAELRNKDVHDLHPESSRGDVDSRWRDSSRPGGVLFETTHRRRDGTTFPVEVSSSVIDIDGHPYLQSFVRDISERHAAGAALRRLATAYALLSETNQAIVRSGDETETIRRVCRVAVEFGGYLGAWVGFIDRKTGSVACVASHGPIGGYVNRLRLSVDPDKPEGRGPTGLALRAGLPRYCEDFLSDPATEPWHDMAREVGIRAHVVLPLRRRGEVTGVLTLCAAQPGDFDAQTRSLLEEMATDVSFALDNFDRKAELAEWANRYEATVKASGQILLDRNLVTGDLKIAGDVQRILGYRQEDLAGTLARWAGIVQAEDRALYGAEMERVARERCPFHLQYRVRRKDGSTIVAQDDGYFVGDASGGAARMIGFVADITERRLAEDRIRGQLEELRRWHSAMLGREIRVLQLKREVNEVLAEAGRPARYESPRAAREAAPHV